MSSLNQQCADRIDKDSERLAKTIAERHCRLNPLLEARDGEAGREKCLQDTKYQLAYLVEAIRSDSPILFNDYVHWAVTLLKGLNTPEEDLQDQLRIIGDVLRETLPQDEAVLAGSFIDESLATFGGFKAISSFISEDGPRGTLAREYLDLLLAGRRREAGQLVLQAAESGVPIPEIYIHIFQASQREVGRLWQTGAISVGQEHFCTAATQMVMSQLYPYIFNTARCGRALVATCVSGETHEIGMRMVTDFFEMAGWDTYYLGANVPFSSVISELKAHKAQVLGISVTISSHIDRARALINAVRADTSLDDIKILIGGYPFMIEPDLWRVVGADAFATDAAEAVSAIENSLPRS